MPNTIFLWPVRCVLSYSAKNRYHCRSFKKKCHLQKIDVIYLNVNDIYYKEDNCCPVRDSFIPSYLHFNFQSSVQIQTYLCLLFLSFSRLNNRTTTNSTILCSFSTTCLMLQGNKRCSAFRFCSQMYSILHYENLYPRGEF